MMKKALVISALTAAVNLFAQSVSAKLSFSYDDGKTWTWDLPYLKNGVRDFWVKIEGVGKESRPLYGGPMLTALHGSADFASANTKTTRIDGKDYFTQKLEVYYSSINKKFVFAYPVNLGRRKAGRTGICNVWDKKQNRWVDGPLPPVEPLPPGIYTMFINIYWHVKEGRVDNPVEFTVTIE